MIMMSDDGPVAIVTFENPPMGLMNMEMVKELDRIVAAYEADDNVRAIVFTGGLPNVFIRHYDVGEIVQAGEFVRQSGRSADDIAEAARVETDIARLFDRVDRMGKPTIAAINGMCMGGGFEFALACDIRVAQPGEYSIGLPETNVDIFPGGGGTQRLPRLVGTGRALEMILRGRVVGPNEARDLGLVQILAEDARSEAIAVAKELTAKAPPALAAARRLVREAFGRPLTDGLKDERRTFGHLLKDDAPIAAMKDFLESGEEIRRP